MRNPSTGQNRGAQVQKWTNTMRINPGTIIVRITVKNTKRGTRRSTNIRMGGVFSQSGMTETLISQSGMTETLISQSKIRENITKNWSVPVTTILIIQCRCVLYAFSYCNGHMDGGPPYSSPIIQPIQ
ncbi:hypothetical protein GDO81_028212 [Engystomops pustulosus]|uniref:Uncharacterized protein n=1 Tax=Engystomops pustulosus TaxID=76066 RepID=A0AAV6YNK4_ENGPU|nr:hypothetical protein GDO81_028212 [Engystomops pustulosus]